MTDLELCSFENIFSTYQVLNTAVHLITIDALFRIRYSLVFFNCGAKIQIYLKVKFCQNRIFEQILEFQNSVCAQV